MKLTTFGARFLAACAVIAGATLVLHLPSSMSVAGLPAAPTRSALELPGLQQQRTRRHRARRPHHELVADVHKLIAETYATIGPEVSDAAEHFAGNDLACQNCHLDGGTNRAGLPRWPSIDECMTRSMNGRKLPDGSLEKTAVLGYLHFIGEPEAVKAGSAPKAPLPASAERGGAVFARICTTCHQADGLGRRRGSSGAAMGYEFPPLWGPDSSNDGAGMDHFERAAGFIHQNMPRGTDRAHPQVSLQEA